MTTAQCSSSQAFIGRSIIYEIPDGDYYIELAPNVLSDRGTPDIIHPRKLSANVSSYNGLHHARCNQLKETTEEALDELLARLAIMGTM